MKTSKRVVTDLDLRGKRVLMRVDFNVPLDGDEIVDATRIKAALPTIEYVLAQNCPLILMSHLGRPNGRRDDALSLKPVAARLDLELGGKKKVEMAPDWIGLEVEEMARELKPGKILMLENTRFRAVEEGKDGVLDAKAKKLEAAAARKRLKAEQPVVAEKLADMADVYVNDAFGAAHRRHVSTAIVAEYAKESAIGLLMKTELDELNRILTGDVERPMIAVIGGAKISGKLEVLQSFLSRMDAILIGGGMAYTFMLADGKSIGGSIHEKELIGTAREILHKIPREDRPAAKLADVELPIDYLVADKIDETAQMQIVGNTIEDGWQGVDIGPKTIDRFTSIIHSAKTIVWNGPMGVFEKQPFAAGTFAIAKAIAESSAYCVVGGGDSVTAINQTPYADRFDHISTGGGASLEFLAGAELPGVAAIPNRRKLFVAGNWKMHRTAAESIDVLQQLRHAIDDDGIDLAICVPYTSLAAAAEVLRGTNIAVGAQNVHWMDRGAFTGEISAEMLKAAGAEFVILGHSERRQYFGETDTHVNLRLRAALNMELLPIVCVGETLDQHNSGLTKAVIDSQIGGCLTGLAASQIERVTLAYEPVWAIGTGLAAEPEAAQRVHAHIRRRLREMFGDVADHVRIQYGGSVNPENVGCFVNQSDIDGALVGGASLAFDTFHALIKAIA